MTRGSRKFIVAGGGIGGLSIAYALAQKGHEIAVLEQATDFTEVGAGIQLAPNGMRALADLGLADPVMPYAWKPEALRMRNGYTGAPIVKLPTNAEFAQRYRAPYCVVHRADLLSILLDACQAETRIDLQTGARVEGYEAANGGVSVRLSSGETVEGDALIGADGLRSAVRQKIVGDGAPEKPRHVVYRGVVPRHIIPDALWCQDVVMWCGDGADFVHYPLRSGELFNLVVTFRSPIELEPDDIEGSLEDMTAPFSGFAPEVHELLRHLPHERRWLVSDREPVANWADGNAVLLGDAAHPMLQYMAQGACQALEDSAELAASLSRHSTIDEAFRAYSHKRYLRTARVQLSARRFIEVCQAGPVFDQVRDHYFKHRPVEKLYQAIDWLYSAENHLRFE